LEIIDVGQEAIQYPMSMVTSMVKVQQHRRVFLSWDGMLIMMPAASKPNIHGHTHGKCRSYYCNARGVEESIRFDPDNLPLRSTNQCGNDTYTI